MWFISAYKTEQNEVLLFSWSHVLFNMFQMWCIDVYFDNDFLDDIMFRTIQFWIKNLERKKSYLISIEDRTKYFLKFSFENGHLITCLLKHVSDTCIIYVCWLSHYNLETVFKMIQFWIKGWASFGSKDEPVLDQIPWEREIGCSAL